MLIVSSGLAGIVQFLLLLMTLVLGSEFIGSKLEETLFGLGCFFLFAGLVVGFWHLFQKDKKLAAYCLIAAIAGFIVTPAVLWLKYM